MDESIRQELLAKTQAALDADDWNAVVGLWQPWIEIDDTEAQYQLAYHYFCAPYVCVPSEDEATRDRLSRRGPFVLP